MAEHGTRARYKAGCDCERCAEANRVYLREQKRRQRERDRERPATVGTRRAPEHEPIKSGELDRFIAAERGLMAEHRRLCRDPRCVCKRA